MAAISSVSWTRKGSVTAKKRIFKTHGDALKQARAWQDSGKSVSFSMHYMRDPITAKRSRLFVVTARKVADWEKHAEEQKGYGVR